MISPEHGHMVTLTEDDVGKTVVNPVGDEIGIVEDFENGTAYVDTHPSWTDRIEARLGWDDDPDIREAPLRDEYVEEVTDDEILLRQDLQIDR
ncbi:PRC-barrel domain containing protein [Halosimplex amylolyticum]|uniref:PRC-barrel domain containing protein n=1 Tax=Halosimplex amylolyticum TaxID=3396616 RepID=UPI003F560C33